MAVVGAHLYRLLRNLVIGFLFLAVPTRLDVETNPPGMLKPILGRKLVLVVLGAEQEKKAEILFKQLLLGRGR